ncbi:MAG: class I SAM-dependent methyltransferase [Candidatus Latescibacteria bacterium]|nr:class I SAM-dependent methyltransferase [Candidatus Latescibacterota bacterium]
MMLTKASLRSHWETFWQRKHNVREVYSNGMRISRNLTLITDLHGKKVLEVGAGTGRDGFNLVRYSAEIYQLDYAESSLKIMKQLAAEKGIITHLINGDAFRLPFRDNSFDTVFHQGLLEHFRTSRAEEILKENVRVLKPGGILLVDVPQRYHIYTLMKHILIAFNAWFAGWERGFSIRELQEEIRKQGLQIVHSYGEWMYPSLFYRVLREVFLKIGVKLPLYPQLFQPLTELRRRTRERLMRYHCSFYTYISIGVLGRKM